MADYTTSNVIVGLCLHREGQYRSLQAVTLLSIILSLLVVVLAVVLSDGSKPVDQVVVNPSPLDAQQVDRQPSGVFSIRFQDIRFAPAGYRPSASPDESVKGSRARTVTPAPAESLSVAGWLDCRPGGIAPSSDFDLSKPPPPLTSFLPKPEPAKTLTDLSSLELVRLPEVSLVTPKWPAGAILCTDSGIVEGIVTLCSDGSVTFQLTRESPPASGFGQAVSSALSQSSCRPAVDIVGRSVAVRFPYRCRFLLDVPGEVTGTRSVVAKLKR
jgi:hypothetical protein